MAKSLNEVLGWKALTGVIQDTRGGVPAEWLPSAFLTTTKPVKGASASYTKISSSRKTARQVHRGSPSKARDLTGVSEVPVNLAHFYEHVIHGNEIFDQIRNFESPEVQAMGQAEIDRKTREFKQIFNNTRTSMIASIFRYGAIYFDADGDLLPSSSNAVVTIDFGVAAGNKNQIGGIIGTTWATDSVDILGNVAAIKELALKTTGYPLRHAFYGVNVLEYIMSNDAIGGYISGNSFFQDSFVNLEIPPGFMGLIWHPVYSAFYNDADGTNQDWFIGDNVIYTPEPSADWWEVLEGSFPVPTSFGTAGGDAVAMLSSVRDVNGQFSYAKLIDDPPAIKHFMGDTVLPVLKVPNAIFISDVVP